MSRSCFFPSPPPLGIHLQELLVRRARWRCQACGRWGALEGHHVVKRAQGGSDFDLDRLVALCPECHAQTDAPYLQGRLIIQPLSDGRFTVEIAQGADKWAIRAQPRNRPGSRESAGFSTLHEAEEPWAVVGPRYPE